MRSTNLNGFICGCYYTDASHCFSFEEGRCLLLAIA